jgi:glycosyltransferase involved in cell wall biosynthesis
LIGIFAGTLLKRPLVVTIHGSDFRMAMTYPSLLKIFLYICKKSQHITCVSEEQKREIERLGIKKDKISVFPMGMDETFMGVGKSRKQGSASRPLAVLSNRNLLPIYNVSLLIRAIPMVLKEEPHTKFFIAGDGSERDHLEQEVKNLNIDSSVLFLGRVPPEEMPNLLARTDIYVSTSLHDGTSVSLLEAMACGAFPVVTDIQSNREWISDGENGFLVSPESEALLSKRIVEAIRNHELLVEASEKNLKIIEQKAYWMNHIQGMGEIYAKVANLI